MKWEFQTYQSSKSCLILISAGQLLMGVAQLTSHAVQLNQHRNSFLREFISYRQCLLSLTIVFKWYKASFSQTLSCYLDYSIPSWITQSKSEWERAHSVFMRRTMKGMSWFPWVESPFMAPLCPLIDLHTLTVQICYTFSL